MIRHQVDRLPVGKGPLSEANFQIGFLRHHVKERNRHLQHQIYFRIGITKQRQARHQHLTGKGGRYRQTQGGPIPHRAQRLRHLQNRQCFPYSLEISLTFRCQTEILTHEQLELELFFNLADPVAHRTRRNKQLIRSLRHITMTRQRLER